MATSPQPLEVRRFVDAVVAGIALAVVSPLLAALAAVVRVRLGSPVLFRQLRAGLHGQPFELVKFRTMTGDRGPDGALLPDEHRLTSLGRMLRASSLDELPELWNVVKGDMALVGPRPLPVAYLPRYTAAEARRHEVRPGLTGWAQVNGRNRQSWEERLAMDVWYVDHRSPLLDLRILLRTAVAVVTREGINAEDHATMAELRPESARMTDEGPA